MAKKYITQGYDDCDDCQWIADETDGDILICNDCEHDMENEISFQRQYLMDEDQHHPDNHNHQHEQMERTKKEV